MELIWDRTNESGIFTDTAQSKPETNTSPFTASKNNSPGPLVSQSTSHRSGSEKLPEQIKPGNTQQNENNINDKDSNALKLIKKSQYASPSKREIQRYTDMNLAIVQNTYDSSKLKSNKPKSFLLLS
ncbi:hypothetical protein RF11_10987 [Thelohanellus kitauei]|uniref:Uncharacterized protein n=1 Tax=Thelohanellus kitauei TaxID=669202 RepID=A0A0C2M9Q8_THEKT|nr:hypothetical protein RF11_10987 [Thelohanellus kitauei]